MTISEAMEQGLTAIRKPHWAFDDDRVELCKLGEKKYGSWATLVSPQSAQAFGDQSLARREMLILGDRADDWVEYVPKQE